MIRSGLRRLASKVKRRIGDQLLGPEVPIRSTPVSAPVAPRSPFLAESVAPVVQATEEVRAVQAAEADAPEYPPLTRQVVEELFEEMVRPALQSDGGDIALVRVDDNDIYVKLLGACRGCPSSTITMKQGIERLLIEEFPQFGSLIQVDGGPDQAAAEAAAGF